MTFLTTIGLSFVIMGTVVNPFLSIYEFNSATSYISYIVSAVLFIVILGNLTNKQGSKLILLIPFAIAYLLTGLCSGNGPLSQSQIQKKMEGKKTNHPQLAKFLTAIIGPLVFGFVINYTLLSTANVTDIEDFAKTILQTTNINSQIVIMFKILIGASLGTLLGTSFSNTSRYISGYADINEQEVWQKLLGLLVGLSIPILATHALPNNAQAAMFIIVFILIVMLPFILSLTVSDLTELEKRKIYNQQIKKLKQSLQYGIRSTQSHPEPQVSETEVHKLVDKILKENSIEDILDQVKVITV